MLFSIFNCKKKVMRMLLKCLIHYYIFWDLSISYFYSTTLLCKEHHGICEELLRIISYSNFSLVFIIYYHTTTQVIWEFRQPKFNKVMEQTPHGAEKNRGRRFWDLQMNRVILSIKLSDYNVPIYLCSQCGCGSLGREEKPTIKTRICYVFLATLTKFAILDLCTSFGWRRFLGVEICFCRTAKGICYDWNIPMVTGAGFSAE